MAQRYTRDELVARLVRAGEIEVTGEDIETVGDYFAPGFEFNGPGGFVADFNGLLDYFASVRTGFDDRSIRRQMQPIADVMLAALSEPERAQLHELLRRALYGAGGVLQDIRLPAAV